MFCRYCGAENADSSSFCMKCGKPMKQPEPQPAQQPAQQSYQPVQQPVQQTYQQPAQQIYQPAAQSVAATPATPPKKKKTALIVGIIIAAVVVLAGAAAAVYFIFDPFGATESATTEPTTPEEFVEQFVDAYYVNCDAEALLDLYLDECVDAWLESDVYGSRDELIDEIDEGLQNVQEELKEEYGDDYKVTYTILSTDDVTSQDSYFLEYRQEVEAELGVNVTATKKVTVMITFQGSLDEDSYSIEVYTVCVDGSWHMPAER